MNKEEIPIEYYLTKNGEVIKFVRYDELDKYKQVLDKIKEWKKQTLFELNRQYKTFEYWEELFEDLDELLEEIDV